MLLQRGGDRAVGQRVYRCTCICMWCTDICNRWEGPKEAESRSGLQLDLTVFFTVFFVHTRCTLARIVISARGVLVDGYWHAANDCVCVRRGCAGTRDVIDL